MSEKEYKVKIIKIEQVTHNVKRFTLEKPDGFSFTSGQANEVSIDKDGWQDEKRPFTFTCLNSDPYLEFTIKIYPEHKGLTEQIGMLKVGDYLIVREPWGTISYKGPGTFIAGGAGITPFISIFRQLYKDNQIKGNTLIFSNKTEQDIIMKEEFMKMLGKDVHFILTREEKSNYDYGHVDEEYLKSKISNFQQHFYLCGPKQMVKAMQDTLAKLGASTDSVVFEE